MKSFFDTARRSLTVFVLLAYILIPLADSMACNDCTEGCSLQGKQISYADISNTVNPGITISAADTQWNSYDYSQDSKNHCPICYNTTNVDTYDHLVLFSTLCSVICPIFEVSPEPSFLINKPPRA